MTKIITISFGLLVCAMGACGKDDPITALDRSSDCSHICSKYKECLNSDYDTDGCEDRCTDMVSKEKTDKIDQCRDCVDGKSCTNSVFSCTSECVGIVP